MIHSVLFSNRMLMIMVFSMAIVTLKSQEDQKGHEALITPKNILLLVPKLNQNAKDTLIDWLTVRKDAIEDILTVDVCGPLEERMQRFTSLTEKLNRRQMYSIEKDKFIFKIEVKKGEAYILKIPSMSIRRSNYNANLLVHKARKQWQEMHGTGKRFPLLEHPVIQAENPFADLSHEDYEVLKQNNGLVTYQGISRVAQRWHMAEYLKEHPTSLIALPKSYLVRLPWRPKDIDDRNYVVCEKSIAGAKGHGYNHPVLLLQALPALAEFARNTGLWDISEKQFMIDHKDRVIPIDLEQPCNTPHEYFYNRHPGKRKRNMEYGLEKLKSMEKRLELGVARNMEYGLEKLRSMGKRLEPGVAKEIILSRRTSFLSTMFPPNKIAVVTDVASLGIPK